MEGFSWWGQGQGVWETEVPQWGPRAKPREGLEDEAPEAEAKCENSVQFLTFSCIKCWI